MRAVKFMLRNILSGISGRRVFFGAILLWSVVGSTALSVQVGGLMCGPEVGSRGRISIAQGDDLLEFESPAWARLYQTIQQAGIVNRELSFLPVSVDGLKAFGFSRGRFQTLRSRLHSTVGGALYDLVLSTTARHVGMRLGEFNPNHPYDSRTAELFYLTFATAPDAETPGSSAWWGNEIFGIFPSFRFLVKKCIDPTVENRDFDAEVCMAREMLSSFNKLSPLLEGKNFEEFFYNSVARHGGTSQPVQGRVQVVLMENFQENNYPAVAYRVFEYTRVKAQVEKDVVLPLPTGYVENAELRRLAGVLISRTEINDPGDPSGGRGMRQIGVSLSLGETEGQKLRVLLDKLRGALHPSAVVSTIPR